MDFIVEDAYATVKPRSGEHRVSPPQLNFPQAGRQRLPGARTLSGLSRIRKARDPAKGFELWSHSPLSRMTDTELPGKAWRKAVSPTSMPSVTGATFEGLASEFSSVGFSDVSTTALAGPRRRLMPVNPMSVVRASADVLTTLRMISPLAVSRVADA